MLSVFRSKLSGSHVLVTGGAKGIGKSIVESYLAEGANVSFCGRTIRGDEFSTFKGAAENARAVGSLVDISRASDIEAWVSKANQEFGKIDIVVANACPGAPLPSIENWELSFRADILGLINLIEYTLPHLQERAKEDDGHPSVVVISSLAGFERRHPTATGPYGTFKRAQVTLAKDYVRKLAPLGIRINTVVPGTIETPNIIWADGTVSETAYQRAKRAYPDVIQGFVDEVPLKRAGSPQDVANSVLFLSSRLASYINGTVVVVDGGLSIGF